MAYFILLVVVVTTALFLFIKIRKTEDELLETQQLLLQFIDQFEEQYNELSAQMKQMEYKTIDSSVQKYNNTDHQRPLKDPDPLLLNERYSDIIKYVDEGMSVEEIAKTIGKGKGEVQLILELLQVHNHR